MGTWRCGCNNAQHEPRLVVLTGGPGAGKTAVLEIIRHHFCEHVTVLPEAAGIIFEGGFPRRVGALPRQAAQRCIFRVQRELEWLAIEERKAAIVLCDRGTLDGAAYWPKADPNGPPSGSFFAANETTREGEMLRYATVIHLRTPPATAGYNHTNPLRVESAQEAAAIDAAIVEIWKGHPHRIIVESTGDFIEKAARAIAAVREEVPLCCRPRHPKESHDAQG